MVSWAFFFFFSWKQVYKLLSWAWMWKFLKQPMVYIYVATFIFLLVVWYFTKVSNLSYLKPTLVLFLWVFSHFLYKHLFKKERWKIKDMNTYGKTTLKAVEGELRGILFKFIKTFYTFSLMSIFPEQFYFILLNNCLVQIYHSLFKQFFTILLFAMVNNTSLKISVFFAFLRQCIWRDIISSGIYRFKGSAVNTFYNIANLSFRKGCTS